MSKIVLLDNKSDLKKAVKSIIKDGTGQIAADFEGESFFHRYGIHLCLVQIYSGNTAYLVDTVKIKNASALKPLFENREIIKVMYSADFDVRLLCFTQNFGITSIFDIQIAAKLLGFTDISLKHLTSVFLDKNFIKSKSTQTSNWNLRPLKPEQIEYAANDVRTLIPLREKLEPALMEKGLFGEFRKKCLELEKVRFSKKENPHLQLKHSRHLLDQEKIYLKHFFDAREKTAEKIDLPPYRVLSHDNLISLSINPPENESEWKNIRGLSKKADGLLKLFREAALKAIKELNGKN